MRIAHELSEVEHSSHVLHGIGSHVLHGNRNKHVACYINGTAVTLTELH